MKVSPNETLLDRLKTKKNRRELLVNKIAGYDLEIRKLEECLKNRGCKLP